MLVGCPARVSGARWCHWALSCAPRREPIATKIFRVYRERRQKGAGSRATRHTCARTHHTTQRRAGAEEARASGATRTQPALGTPSEVRRRHTRGVRVFAIRAEHVLVRHVALVAASLHGAPMSRRGPCVLSGCAREAGLSCCRVLATPALARECRCRLCRSSCRVCGPLACIASSAARKALTPDPPAAPTQTVLSRPGRWRPAHTHAPRSPSSDEQSDLPAAGAPRTRRC